MMFWWKWSFVCPLNQFPRFIVKFAAELIQWWAKIERMTEEKPEKYRQIDIARQRARVCIHFIFPFLWVSACACVIHFGNIWVVWFDVFEVWECLRSRAISCQIQDKLLHCKQKTNASSLYCASSILCNAISLHIHSLSEWVSCHVSLLFDMCMHYFVVFCSMPLLSSSTTMVSMSSLLSSTFIRFCCCCCSCCCWQWNANK